jgi:hypothetical protein
MPGNVVMWGAPYSGKTTYVASLVFWREDDEDGAGGRQPRLCVLPANPGAADWAARRARDLIEGRLLEKTSAVETVDFRLYELPPERPGFFYRGSRTSRHVADLTLCDVPGEVFEQGIPDALMEQMVHARGLMLMLNPFPDPTGHEGVRFWEQIEAPLAALQHAMEAARRRGERVAFDPAQRRIRYPVAICLTQVDRSDTPDRDPRRWLDELLGEDRHFLYGWLERHEVFTLSARGAEHGDHDVPGAPGAPDAPDAPALPEPYGVMAPLEWILSQSEEAGR